MDADTILVIGLVLAVLSVPAMISAYADGRPPRVPILALLVAGALVLFAAQTRPGGYRLAEIPDVFYSVVGRILN